jgi:hypothetical protein
VKKTLEDKQGGMRGRTSKAEKGNSVLGRVIAECGSEVATGMVCFSPPPLPEQVKPLRQIHPSCSEKTKPSPVIYALVDPRNRILVRYVGRSATPERRFYNILHARRGITLEWIATLKADGVEPEMWVLEEGDSPKREWFWIQFFRGPDLITNHSSLASCSHSPYA